MTGKQNGDWTAIKCEQREGGLNAMKVGKDDQNRYFKGKRE